MTTIKPLTEKDKLPEPVEDVAQEVANMRLFVGRMFLTLKDIRELPRTIAAQNEDIKEMLQQVNPQLYIGRLSEVMSKQQEIATKMQELAEKFDATVLALLEE